MRDDQSFREDKRVRQNRALGITIILLSCLSWQCALAQETKPAAQGVVQDSSFQSVSLQRKMTYRIYLPRHHSSSVRYPVLYLLHGLYGDYRNWDTLTHLADYMRDRQFIVVMPDAGNSWYVNSVTEPSDRFEDYIAKDLVSEIDRKYRTIPRREGRAIAGLSMGGYGAIKIALKYPEKYVFAGSLSGALDAARTLAEEVPEYHDQLVKVLGEPGNPARAENDVFSLLAGADPAREPYFYIACGASDRFLKINRDFVKELSARNFAYEYHETSGGHEWPYWDRAVQPLLDALAHHLTPGR
jgi:putative tributyrin esterase